MYNPHVNLCVPQQEGVKSTEVEREKDMIQYWGDEEYFPSALNTEVRGSYRVFPKEKWDTLDSTAAPGVSDVYELPRAF